MKKKRPLQITAEQWNEAHPVGTTVRYYPLLNGSEFVETKTRSEAWDMCGTTVVMIEGKSGGCAVQNMKVV